MASTTVNNTVGGAYGTQGFDVSAVINSKAAANGKKATQTTSDFSQVLSGTTQNSKSGQDSTNATQETKTTADSKASDNTISDTRDTQDVKDDAKLDAKDVDDKVAVTDEPTKDEEVKPDDNVIEEIATALNFIIDQVKGVIGADEDTIQVTMEDLGLDMGDLLNSDNLAQLVTALSGEDSTISLVANEDLYSKLQNLTQIVDTQFENVLDNTGLSTQELDEVLENIESFMLEDNGEVVDEEVDATPILDDNTAKTGEIATESLVNTKVKDDEPIVTVEDNTSKTANNVANSKINESSQDTVELKNDSQSADTKSEKSQNSHEEKDYSQNQNFSQNQDTGVNEEVAQVAKETTSYTSENAESIMRQLADTVKLIKDENMTQMELQLHPASLGTVNVSLITKGGTVTAQFTTQSEQVRAAIEAQASTLTQNLEEQGVKVEAIEVTVESHQMEKNLDEDNRKREKEEEKAEESLKATRRANINLRELGEDGDLIEEIQGADEATRIAMELMSAHGNSMDLLA